MLPLISIIVPVYKTKSDYLSFCIESCLNQTYHNIEIILVDDGTPDDGGVICDEYSKIDSRIVVIHKQNQGVSSARNAGISVARGDYVTFVDSDDWIEKTLCENIAAIIQKHSDVDIVIFSLVKNYENITLDNVSLFNGDSEINTSDDIRSLKLSVLEASLDKNVLRMTFCKAVKKSIITENSIRYDESLPLCEDVVFWFEIFQHINSAFYIDKEFYHYRQVIDSATDRYRRNADVEHQMMLSRLEQLINNSDTPQDYQFGYYLEVFYSIQRCITQLYFHRDNKDSYFKKVKASHREFAKKPYCDMHKYVKFSRLTTNHKIKYFFIRIHMYGTVEIIRNAYRKITKRKLT